MTPIQRILLIGWDTCLACHKDIAVTNTGVLRVHGPPHARCRGNGSYGRRTQHWMAEENYRDTKPDARAVCAED